MSVIKKEQMIAAQNKNLEIFRKKKCDFCRKYTTKIPETINIAGIFQYVFCDKCEKKITSIEKGIVILAKIFVNHKDKDPEDIIKLINKQLR